ncbi:hypothetical protein Pcaca04_24040 [Pectobacterium carotovorum subsp. carotovorum]|nr:hypothetical protein Pcaca04_24040 [Pectobacterium carotovorum subsp. carotovorum]
MLSIFLLLGCGPSEKEMIEFGENEVRATLKDPTSAIFESFYVKSGENNGYICGTVNAKNSYGGYIGRKNYYVYVEVKNRAVSDKSPAFIINDDDNKSKENFKVICVR